MWAFEPPMSEQFGIERDNDDRLELVTDKGLNLPAAHIQKMRRMRVGQAFRGGRIVKRLVTFARGNAVVFYAGKLSLPARDRSKMLERKIETCIPVEFAIMRD